MHIAKIIIAWGTILSASIIVPSVAMAETSSGDIFYTDFVFHTVNKVHYDFDGLNSFTIGTPTLIQTLGGADGIIFDTAGNLLVGGAGPDLYRVNPTSGHVDTSTTPGASNFHLGLDPTGTRVWAGGIPGPLNEVGLPGFGPGTVHSVTLSTTGTPIGVDTIAFDPTHGNQAYFTSSFPNGNGLFGTIDLNTFVATPIIDPAEPFAKISSHGLTWDTFTNQFILMGNSEVSTYDPSTGKFKSEEFPGIEFDQGTVDGHGHLFIAGVADLTFIDYSSTLDPTSASDFQTHQFIAAFLDDVAPLSGPGSPPPLSGVPESSTYGLCAATGLIGLIFARRKLGKRSLQKRSV